MSLAFSPDGTRLALADIGNDTVHLRNLATGAEVRQPGPDRLSCVAFTPDGRRLACSGYDGQVHLADGWTGEELLVLRSVARPKLNYGCTPRLAFSRDGTRLAANGVFDLSFWEIGGRPAEGPEPAPVDTASWLREGRALAGRGDAEAAEAAYDRARGFGDGDPAAWIEHAVLLGRRGDAAGAREAMERGLRAMPDRPAAWRDLARQLADLGRAAESASALAKAGELARGRLAAAPDNDEAAAVLAEALPPVDADGGWTPLRPDVLRSAEGATLTRLADDSVLAGGPTPATDAYTLEAEAPLTRVTDFRLEALPDPSLPHLGPGRSSNGNFLLGEIRLTTVPESGAPLVVRLTRVRADYSQANIDLKSVSGTLGADSTTAWAIWPEVGRPHWIVFKAAQPLGTATGTRLRVELDFRTRFPNHALGRFRLSVTDRPFPPSLQAIRTDTERSGLTRLGAAYILIGEWAPAAAVLEQAAARPDAPALDGLLLALARHRLGRGDEARSDCDRALGRLGSGLADEATRDVAVEALMTIRGRGVDAAEALLLDLKFPADPIGP
jgi:tetratricopeptide (TPR) repeat protein